MITIAVAKLLLISVPLFLTILGLLITVIFLAAENAGFREDLKFYKAKDNNNYTAVIDHKV